MPFVNPRLLPTERVSKFKILLDSHINKDISILLENKSKKSVCRIVIQIVQRKKIKLLIAESENEGDLLENEWGYVIKDLPSVLAHEKERLKDSADLYNWLNGHFSLLWKSKSTADLHLTGDGSTKGRTLRKMQSAPMPEKEELEVSYNTTRNLETMKITDMGKEGLKKVKSNADSDSSDESETHKSRDEAKDVEKTSSFFSSFSVRKIGIILVLNLIVLSMHEFHPKLVLSCMSSVLSIILFQYMNWQENELHMAAKNESPKKALKKKVHLNHAHIDSDGAEDFEDSPKKCEGPHLRRETVAKADKKLKPGDTMVEISSEEHEKGAKKFGEWTNAPGDTFPVRIGPDYALKKKKAPSENALYEVIGADMFSLDKKIWHIGRFFDMNLLEKIEGNGKIKGFPIYLIINVLAPQYAPGVFTNAKDGIGFSCTLFCKLSAESMTLIENDQLSPSLNLFKRFVDESSVSPQMRGRLKCIGRATNTEELKLGRLLTGLVSRYNGTPFLIHDGEAEFFTGLNYFEMTIDMHSFSNVTKNAFFQLKDSVKDIRSHFAFLIEGRENDELPEQVLVAVELFNLGNLIAKQLPVQIIEEEETY
jgi:hypothetical protein